MFVKRDDDPKFKKKWADQRRNKWSYMLRVGVLLFGVAGGSFTYLAMVLLDQYIFSWLGYFVSVLMFSFFGLFTGFRAFNNNEKRYQQILFWEKEENALE